MTKDRIHRPEQHAENTPATQNVHRIAPGKVTRTSKLARNRPRVTQRKVPAADTRPRENVRSAWDQTMDPWMDMAHRGLSALASPAEGAVQAKLMLDTPGSASEREAEQVGTQAARSAAPARSGQAPGTSSLTPLSPAPLHHALGRGQGPGQPLPADLRVQMEQAYQTDLSAVRVHTDTGAARLNTALQARAVTSGSHIFVQRGHYQPETDQGRELLGHELSHVIQQQGVTGLVQRATDMNMLASTQALPQFQFQGEEGLSKLTVKELIDRKDAQQGGVARDENYNNLDKRRFEEALATFVFNRWDLVGDVVLEVSAKIQKYIAAKDKLGLGTKKESMAKLQEKPTTLGSPGFDPSAKDFSPEQGEAILLDQIPASLPAHLNVHGKFSYAMYTGEAGDFARSAGGSDEKSVAAKVFESMGGEATNHWDVLAPDELFGKPEAHSGDPEKGRPRLSMPELDKLSRPQALYISGLAPRANEEGLDIPEQISGRPTNSKQAHDRGGDMFYLDETKRWTQEARLLYDMPVMAGPSGSAAYMLNTAMTMGLSRHKLWLYSMALVGSIVAGGHHTFHEIMTVARIAGVPYVPGNYLSAIPPEFLEDPGFQDLAQQFFEPVSDFSERTRSDEATPPAQVGQELQFGLPPIANNIKALKEYIARHLDLDPSRITIQNINEGAKDTKGVSGSPVYMVSYDQKRIGVIKIFQEFGEMAQELSAMEQVNSLGIPGLQAPKVLSVGKVVRGDKDFGMMMSSLAPGVALDDLMEAVGKADEQKRGEAMDRLASAVSQVGTTLAALHGSGNEEREDAGPGKAFADMHMKKVREYAGEACKSQLALSSGLKPEPFMDVVQRVIEGFAKNPGPSAFIHGDAHPGNFFHHPGAGVTAIDTPTMDTSIGSEDRPLGSPARDTANFVHKLQSVGSTFRLTPKEIGLLQKTFAGSYKSVAKHPKFSPQAFTFFRLRTLLSELRNALKNGEPETIVKLIDDILGVEKDGSRALFEED